MRTIMITAVLLGCIMACAGNTEDPTMSLVKKLLAVKNDEYIKLRSEVLNCKNLENVLTDLKRAPVDWRSVILADALLYRKKNMEEASLIESCLSLHPFRSQTSSNISLVDEDRVRFSPDCVVICFGTESSTIVIESLLFSKKLDVAMCAKTLLRMHCESADRVFLEMAKSGSPIEQAAAIYNLNKMIPGLPAEEIGPNITERMISKLPEILQKRAMKRKVPELRISDDVRRQINDVASNLLVGNSAPQVKAVAAYVLRSFGEKATTRLIQTLNKDSLPWIRAWCADSLLAIGGEEAFKAVESAKKTEKNSEVLRVLQGKAKPYPPWHNVPTDSILLGGRSAQETSPQQKTKSNDGNENEGKK